MIELTGGGAKTKYTKYMELQHHSIICTNEQMAANMWTVRCQTTVKQCEAPAGLSDTDDDQ